MSDDEDYMSDKFLLASEKPTPSSLIYRRSDRREFALMKKKTEHESRMKEQNKSIRVVEAEKREEGLSSAITSTNKGPYLAYAYYIDMHRILYILYIRANMHLMRYKNIFEKVIF